MLYNIYAGLGGGFGGANYQFTSDYPTEEAATKEAYQLAVEEYQSYEGLYGLSSREEIAEELCEVGEDFGFEVTEDDIAENYLEEVESWISYYAIKTSEDDNIEESELDIR